MDYAKDVHIDESALDIEWLEQPALMYKYSRILADARLELDKKKDALDLVKARLDKGIRMDPEKHGIEKLTENALFAAIIAHPDYIKANEQLLEAKYEADVAYGAVKAIDARKDALENLVRLNGQQYFAGPKMPRDIAWERESKEKKTEAGISSIMNRTK